MKRVFGVKKDKEPPPSLNDASDRINKRGETVDEKIKRLDGELARYKEQIKRTRPGPAQEAVKARAMRVLKQKRMYEGQRDMLYNQTFNLDQVAFASEGIKDAQQTVCFNLIELALLGFRCSPYIAFVGSALWEIVQSMQGGAFSVLWLEVAAYLHEMSALKSANKELKGMMKTVKIQDIDVSIQF
ncbi:Snf7 [Cynara cardunculus var. scolymus]|uniref:Snf7 n=1 Tax=Cynara cardunculus var. scolymus TaxID=59895 RepID=A0A103YE31_CYNCS|nr:Snf7 [Cynara cardunculus var. scolymus]